VTKKVIVFREHLLPVTETFIESQAGALVKYSASFVGLKRHDGGLLLNAPVITLTGSTGRLGSLAAALYRQVPLSPDFHRRSRRVAPDLIHAHFAVDAVEALSLQRVLRVPLVVTLHGYDVTTRTDEWKRITRGRRYLARLPRLFHQASRFLCVSNAIRQRAISAGFPEAKLVVHYTGVDCTRFAALEPNQRDRALIVFVGRLIEVKGCEYLLRAMALLGPQAAMNVPARLVVIGDGPLRGELEALSRRLKLNAQFLGAQPFEVVRQWIGRARILCNPSVTSAEGNAEGFGMVFAEAQAMGTPVVSSLYGGIPEAVCHGKTGLLAPERDVPMLATHLHRFLTDDAFWQSCSVRAAAWVRQQFDLHKQTRQLENIYDEVIMEAKTRDSCLKRSERYFVTNHTTVESSRKSRPPSACDQHPVDTPKVTIAACVAPIGIVKEPSFGVSTSHPTVPVGDPSVLSSKV
jgi:colanic acid/amylovoran biosynthesis glycosyltransferase